MDPRTFQRSLQGDLDALQAVEVHFKTVARTLLEHPGLGVEDTVTRRVLTNAAVAEVLERNTGDADTALASTVMSAARRAVEHRRRSTPQDPAAGHLPAGILVSAALVPQVLATASREAAERHLACCEPCADLARRVREAAAAAVGQAESETGAAAVAPGSPPLDDEDPSEQDIEGSSSLDVEGLMARLAGPGKAGTSARGGERRRVRRLLDPRRNPGAGEEPPLRLAPVVLLALAFVTLGVWAGWGHLADRAETSPPDPRLAVFASLDLPPRPSLADVPAPLEPGLRDLATGDCAMATKRLHLARVRAPDLALAWYWEGLTAVCAGQGAAAQEALRGAQARDPGLADLEWYLAQAALLAGDAATATTLLAGACEGIGARSRQACGIYARISDLEQR